MENWLWEFWFLLCWYISSVFGVDNKSGAEVVVSSREIVLHCSFDDSKWQGLQAGAHLVDEIEKEQKEN